MSEFLAIGAAAALIGVAISTLRRWESEGKLKPDYRTLGGHRRYQVNHMLQVCGKGQIAQQRMTLCYARVSSNDQKADLGRQGERLRQYAESEDWENIQLIEDLGSGLNYKKKGLQQLIRLICARKVKRLVLTHKDRLLRFGSEIIFALCSVYGTDVMILEEKEEGFEQRLCHDVLELMTVFSARLYGSRSHKNQRALKAA